MTEKLTGVVLAGGRSSRFGTDKARALLDREALLSRVVRTAARICDEVLVVVASGRDYADLLDGSNVGTVTDPAPHEGPLAGVLAGLGAAGDGWALVCSCDTPLLQAPLLQLLVERRDKRVPAVLCEVEGRLQPFPSLVTTESLVKLRAAFDRGERRVGRALEQLGHVTVTDADVRAVDPQLLSFRNVNTPEDLVALEAAVRSVD